MTLVLRALLQLSLAVPAAAQAEADFTEKLRLAQLAAKPAQAPAAPASPAPKKKAPALKAAKAAKPAPLPAAAPASPTAQAVEQASLETRVAALESKAAVERVKWEALAHLRLDAQPGRQRGLYARRVEAKLTAKLFNGGSAVLGYDFAENKLKDLGLEWEGYGAKLQAGQFRQKFGVEPQAGSARTWFAERALIYGGTQPLGPVAKLVSERVMGLHGGYKKKWGGFGVDLGASLAGNLTEDQAAGKNKLGSTDAFPKQAAEEQPSYVGRAGVEAELAWLKLKLGASGGRESLGARADDLAGLDFSADLGGLWKWQAEWASIRPREGWVLQQSLEPLRLFMKEAPAVELLGRLEGLPDALGAVTAGIKWTYAGKQHLLLQYSAYYPRQDFSVAPGAELWVLQQQLAF
jgi:hypothetical protein